MTIKGYVVIIIRSFEIASSLTLLAMTI